MNRSMNPKHREQALEQSLSRYAWLAIAITLSVILCAQLYSRISWEIYSSAHSCEINNYLIESHWKPTIAAWTCDDGSTHFR